VAWRPVNSGSKFTRNILVTVDCEGLIQHWHAPSGKLLDTIEDKESLDP